MKLKIIIVDDEPLAQELIKNLLIHVSEVEILGAFATGRNAIEAINLLKPDILFLDIQLKHMTGFEILDKIEVSMPLIIFVTAFDKYAIDAFNIFAFDYLLKPFTEERFYKSVFKAIETQNTKSSSGFKGKTSELLEYIKSKQTNSRLPVSHNNRTVLIDTDDINYVLASNYHIEIFTSENKYVVRNSMYSLLAQLNSALFIRVHRSSIVNVNQIDELITSSYGELDIKMKNGFVLRVSRGYRKKFLLKVGMGK